MKVKDFFKKFGIGAVIGAAMIIPGVSGGTIAVLCNIYDKLISAISDLRKDFKNSFMFLLPVALGAVCAVAAIFYPLKLLFEIAPFPTVMLFFGLMAGGVPKLFKDGAKNGFKKINLLSVLIPLAAVAGVCFIPSLGEADLTAAMPVWGYFVLIIIGAVASCALVVPGVSGSMLLMIFGYFNPILGAITGLKTDFGHYFLVLALFALGILIGFFSIAKLMKLLMKKFPRGTFWAIFGFVIGSLPAILLTYDRNFPYFPLASLNAAHISAGVILAVAGAVASFALTAILEAKMKKHMDKTEQIMDNSAQESEKINEK